MSHAPDQSRSEEVHHGREAPVAAPPPLVAALAVAVGVVGGADGPPGRPRTPVTIYGRPLPLRPGRRHFAAQNMGKTSTSTSWPSTTSTATSRRAGINIYGKFAGGAAYLAKAVKDRQATYGDRQATVFAGDNIGASPLANGLFFEEPITIARTS